MQHPAEIKSRAARILEVVDHIETVRAEAFAERQHPADAPARGARVHHHLIHRWRAFEKRAVGGARQHRDMGAGVVLADGAERAFRLHHIAKGAVLDDEDAFCIGGKTG